MLRGLSLLIAVCLLAGCPGKNEHPDSGTPDAGPTQVSPVEMCDRLATAKCGLLARCYAAFNRFTPEDCHSFENAICLDDYMKQQASFDADKAEVDGEHLGQCEARMSQSSCPPTFPPGYSAVAAHPFADCTLETGLIKGKVKSGDTCDRPIECEPNSVCVKPDGVCKGTCSRYAQAGEGCAIGCAPGLFCDDKGTPADSNDDTCAVPRGQNESCSSSVQCAAELVCTNGQCRPRGGAGQGCAFDVDRLSTCEPGLACDVTPFVPGATGTCVVPKSQGSSCQFHWSCGVGMVCADLVWTGFPGVAPPAGDCRPASVMGENCGPTPYQSYVGDQCGPGLGCGLVSGTCDPEPKMGETCVPSAQNCVGVNVYCKPAPGQNSGTCTGPVSDGQPCAFTIDAEHTVTVPCQTGFCDAQSTQSCRMPYLDEGAICQVDGQCRTNRCAVQQDQSLRCAAACQ